MDNMDVSEVMLVLVCPPLQVIQTKRVFIKQIRHFFLPLPPSCLAAGEGVRRTSPSGV